MGYMTNKKRGDIMEMQGFVISIEFSIGQDSFSVVDLIQATWLRVYSQH